MALDGIFLNLLIEDIKKEIIGSRVDKIYQPGKSELVFCLRTRTAAYKLFCSANAGSPRINLTTAEYDNPASPPMLCMLLRKRLGSAFIEDIRQDGLDRVVFIDFLAVNEIGDKEKLVLVIEIMAQHSNIILLNSDNIIIDSVKRVDSEKSSYREVLPGRNYIAPPPQNKLDIRSAGNSEILTALRMNPDARLSAALLKVLSGISPLTSRELASSCYDEDALISSLGNADVSALCSSLDKLRSLLSGGSLSPTLLLSADGQPFEFSFWDIKQYGELYQKRTYSTLSQLLDAFYCERDNYLRMKSRSHALYLFVDTSVERITRKLSARAEELKISGEREKLRIFAELITANQYALTKGSTAYEVSDYYNDGALVRIPVNPALTPSQNAQKYYKDYRKAQNAQKMLESLITEGERELDYFLSVRDLLSRVTTDAEIRLISEELAAGGYLSARKKQGRVIKSAKLPPIEYTTSDGYTVLVGRNNIQNDELSFKIARKTDYWFHVQKAAGSHVILQTRGEELSDTAVTEAAAIAAKHSSFHGNPRVTVDYTAVANLKKPSGAKPGFVIYYTYYSIIT